MKSLVAYGVAYLLWALSLPLGGWVVIDLRDTVLTALAVINVKMYHNGTREAFYANLRLRAADTTSWLVVGVLLIAVIVVIENVYRTGVPRHMWSRFCLVVAVCLGLLGLFGLTNDLMRLAIGVFTWRGLFAPGVYIIFSAFFFSLWKSRSLKENQEPD